MSAKSTTARAAREELSPLPDQRPVRILLLEDNPADVILVQESISESDLNIELTAIEDGEAGLDYLYQRGKHAAASRPDLILLDLNLPKKSGKEVLKSLKGNPKLANIPVVVVSGMEASDDIVEAYSLHANCFITKPGNLTDAMQLMNSVLRYWFHVVRLPQPAANAVIIETGGHP